MMLMPVLTSIVSLIAFVQEPGVQTTDPATSTTPTTTLIAPVVHPLSAEEEATWKAAYDRTMAWSQPAPFVLWELMPVEDIDEDTLSFDGSWHRKIDGRVYCWNGSQWTWCGTPGHAWWGFAEDYWRVFPIWPGPQK